MRAHVQPFPEKRVIWQNIDLDLEDWIGDLKAEHGEVLPTPLMKE